MKSDLPSAAQTVRVRLWIVAFAVLFVSSCAVQTNAIRGKVVDAVSGSPVANATILFYGGGWEGTFTGHGGKNFLVFSFQTESDAQGDFAIPALPVAEPSFGNTNYGTPQLLVFRREYLPAQVRGTDDIIIRSRLQTGTWRAQLTEGKVILRKPGSDDEYRKSLIVLRDSLALACKIQNLCITRMADEIQEVLKNP
jgi:hypothetical protein